MLYNPAIFPDNWVRLPYNGQPVYPIGGPVAGIQRRVVREWFAKQTYTVLRHHPTSTVDDFWIASVTRWLRRIGYAHKIGQVVRPIPDPSVLVRMRHCAPSGYKLENTVDRPHRYCEHIACLFCYARKVANRYRPLLRAIRKAPTGSKLFLGRLVVVGSRRSLQYRIQKIRPAAAVTVSIPGMGEELGKWVHRAVLLTDDKDRFKGLRTERLRGAAHRVAVLSDWLRYPIRWRNPGKGTLGLVDVINSLKAAEPPDRPKGQKWATYFAAYGAARPDYVSGKGLLDFAGAEPKG